MCNRDDHPTLVEQLRRNRDAPGKPITRRLTPPLMTEADTALLLDITETALRHWRTRRRGPQPIRRSEGWFYNADRIDRLAAMPRGRRMFVISYSSH
jgi:hypothetical protein